MRDNSKIVIEKRATLDEKLHSKAPYTLLFKEILEKAVKLDASDIHIEPKKDKTRIRLRVDKKLFIYKEIDQKHTQGFINEAKRLSNIPISMRGRPFNGEAIYPELGIKLRCATIRKKVDDMIVYRVAKLGTSLSLDKLNFDAKTTKDLRKAISYQNGIILISGGTGSGKTTTLHSLINEIDLESLKVISFEDPIEIENEDIDQVPIDEKLAFSEGLKQAKRLDPDILFFGEIRDSNAAKEAYSGGQSGHLVLSTIHANSPIGSILKFKSLLSGQNISNSEIKEVFKFVAAQRLLRKVCQNCSIPIEEFNDEELQAQAKNKGVLNARVLNKNGCESCNFLGSRGKTSIISYLDVNKIREFEFSSDESMQKFKSDFFNIAKSKVESGEVCFKEVIEIE